MSIAGASQADRLRLSPVRPWREHLRLYVDLYSAPAVADALWPGALGGARSQAQATQLLASDIEHWQLHAFGPWLFFEARSGIFVGRGGLRRGTVAGREGVEVVYAVRPDAWGRGYASEITIVSLARARRLGLREVLGLVAVGNDASLRVLEKAGLQVRGRCEHAGLPHVWGRFVLAG